MRILIATMDYMDDPYNQAWEHTLRDIRRHNSNGGGTITIFDPYGEEGDCTMGEADKMFGFARTENYKGIIMQCGETGKVKKSWDGYPEIKAPLEFEINPYYMPMLSQDTLVAYMPQIPWDDFGNHLRLEGEEAEQFMTLWNLFLQQNKHLYNAINRGDYPLDCERSIMGYIFMNEEIK